MIFSPPPYKIIAFLLWYCRTFEPFIGFLKPFHLISQLNCGSPASQRAKPSRESRPHLWTRLHYNLLKFQETEPWKTLDQRRWNNHNIKVTLCKAALALQSKSTRHWKQIRGLCDGSRFPIPRILYQIGISGVLRLGQFIVLFVILLDSCLSSFCCVAGSIVLLRRLKPLGTVATYTVYNLVISKVLFWSLMQSIFTKRDKQS